MHLNVDVTSRPVLNILLLAHKVQLAWNSEPTHCFAKWPRQVSLDYIKSLGKRIILALVKPVLASSEFKQFLIFPIEMENHMFITLVIVDHVPEALINCSSKQTSPGTAAAIRLVFNWGCFTLLSFSRIYLFCVGFRLVY